MITITKNRFTLITRANVGTSIHSHKTIFMTNEKRVLKAFANHKALQLQGLIQLTGLTKSEALRVLVKLRRKDKIQRIKIAQGNSVHNLYRIKSKPIYLQQTLF